jgi:hypothetical protein
LVNRINEDNFLFHYVKSLEVTVILIATADGVALVYLQELCYIARHSQRHFHGARRAVFTRTLIKAWPMPELKAYGARRADDCKNVSSLAFASANPTARVASL